MTRSPHVPPPSPPILLTSADIWSIMQLSDPQICAALWLSVARGSFAHAGMTGSPRYVAMLGRFAVVALQHGAGDRARTLLHAALVAVQAHPEGFKAEQGKIVYHLFDTIAAFGDAADRELLGTTLTEVLGDGVDAYVLPQKRRVQELMKAAIGPPRRCWRPPPRRH